MEKTQDMMQEFSFLKRLKTNEFFIKRELLKSKAIPGSLKNAKNIICAKKHKNLEYIWPSKKFYSISQYKEYDFIPDIALMFGEDECEENIQLIDYAFKLGLPVYVAENGFLRGIHFFTQKTKDDPFTDGYSFIINSVQYYDATKSNSIEDDLNSYNVTFEEIEAASQLISKIRQKKLSKYNDQPEEDLSTRFNKSKSKVLIVDQAYNDLSIIKGYANDSTFKRMLNAALDENPNSEVIIKTHPEGNQGARKGYYSSTYDNERITVFNKPVNPYDLINICDKVYVCSSQLGFEALMAGKEVHTFGMPIYAGWGLTKDYLSLARRQRKLTLEEFFHIFYIRHTIYVDPAIKGPCSIDRAIDILLSERDRYFSLKKK